MAVDKNSVQQFCDQVTREVASLYNGLTLHFIVHGKADFSEMLALSEHAIYTHPASNSAQAIIRKQATNNKTSFLGLAIHQKKTMMGLKTEDSILGLSNINIDEFSDENEARETIYHLAWHAIDLFEIRKEPQYRKKFAYGPMVPKRSALNLSKANLQADVFAALLTSIRDQQDGVLNIAKRRGLNSLLPVPHIKAEDYPYIVAQEACAFALSEFRNEPIAEECLFEECRKVSLDIGQAFDEASIRQWWKYATPAQDMAWRGFSKEDILGGAVNTCDDTFVRATSLMVSQITNIEPSPAAYLDHTYNAFLDTKSQAITHASLVDTVFEEAISDASGDDGSRALLDAANRQNEGLTEGLILGWCANALQEAAQAFEKALLTGSSPIQAARMQFEGNKGDTSWDMLKELGDSVVDQRRQGFAVTMGHIAEIAHNNPAFAPVLGSLKITMNDPGYLQKLEAANDLAMTPTTPANVPTMAPKGPTPKGPELSGPKVAPNIPSTPTPAPTPAGMPSFGSKDRSKQMETRRKLLAARQAEANTEKNSGDQPND